MNTTWKHTERVIARALGGERVSKRGLGSNAPDVLARGFAVEVKHRATLPAWLTDAMAQSVRNAPDGKLPLVVLHEAGQRHTEDLVMMHLADFREWFGDVEDRVCGLERR